MEFHQRLKKFREEKGLSPKDMARELEVSLSTYRDWEYGRKILGEPYMMIAQTLGIGLNELFGNEDKHYKEIKNAINKVKITLKELEDACESFF